MQESFFIIAGYLVTLLTLLFTLFVCFYLFKLTKGRLAEAETRFGKVKKE